MNIDKRLMKEATGLELKGEINVENLGLVNNNELQNMLTFLDTEKFIPQANRNKNIAAIFITEQLSSRISSALVQRIICDDPRYYFYSLYNFMGRTNYVKKDNLIDSSAKIHPRACIADYNVEIGRNVIIEPSATILPDVTIRDHCYIMAGAVLGSMGFEYKRTSRGNLPVFHDGKVILHEYVEIGANTCIDKGFSYRDTVIGTHTKIDNLVHIAHAVHIGKNCLVVAGAMLAGTVTLKDNVWIGPHANVAPQVTIENGGFVTLGSIVTKNVGENEWVSGNFAIPHQKFLENLKKSLE